MTAQKQENTAFVAPTLPSFYFIYRNGKQFKVSVENGKIHFDKSLIAELTKEKPVFGKAGKTVYLRSYARKVIDSVTGKERRETWEEICYRVTQYSFSLHIGRISPKILDEAADFFEAMYLLKIFPAGRTMWIGGTEFAEHNPIVNMNCAYRDIDSPQAFYEIALLLMGGTGVGFGASKDAVAAMNELSPINRDMVAPKIVIEQYNYQEDTLYTDTDMVNRDVTYLYYNGSILAFDIADSREGWARFYRDFAVAYTTGDIRMVTKHSKIDYDRGRQYMLDTSEDNNGFINEIHIRVNRVRPKGTALKRFGGTASGPEPLFDFVKDFSRMVEVARGNIVTGKLGWNSTLIVDTVNLEGRSTVAGGTRRSALIALGDEDDTAFAKMKTGEWYIDKSWRSQSNNSQVFYKNPGYDRILEALSQALLPDPETGAFPGGEPGLINGEVALKRNYRWKGLNPCAEILLDSGQTCNLTETNMKAFVKNGEFQYNEFLRCLRLATRHNLRITNITINDAELPGWDYVQKRDRLLGVALSSMVSTKESMGWTNDYMGKVILSPARAFVRDVADYYAEDMGINKPLLVTTIKPSGSISLIPEGTSPGVHPPFAPHYIRRIEVGKHDGVARTLRYMGVPHQAKYSELAKKGLQDLDPYSNEAMDAVDTAIFEFPVSSSSKKTVSEYTALEQLDFYLTTMKYWTDHNTSCTIYVAPHEVSEVAAWVNENWDNYCGISFFPKSDGIYKQAPYEAVTKERFNELIENFPNLDDMEENLKNIEESGVTFSDLMEMCENGACPQR